MSSRGTLGCDKQVRIYCIYGDISPTKFGEVNLLMPVVKLTWA